ncbi:hypothetical protein AAHA92_29965 [Salvia divinorum]|uniref:Disease resistance R13L4/SHOC-2-like LRR domain-containing protein n=1 Tax=Salvia divinorum TaxID=28513 RepID=A0ABD1G031_SALDI
MSTDGDPNTDHVQSPPPTKKADNVPETQAQAAPEKTSRWKKTLNMLRSKGHTTKPPLPLPLAPPSSHREAVNQGAASLRQFIEADLREMHKEAKDLTKYNNRLTGDLQILQSIFDDIKNNKQNEEETLRKFRREVMKVKLTIPSNIGAHKDKQEKKLQLIKELICGEETKRIPQLHKNPLFETSMEFKDFEVRYDMLEDHLKLCLLCLSIFPHGAVVKKRLMLQWWVVEGFAPAEEVAEEYLKELMDKGFIIEAAPGVNSCRFHPFHRSVLVELAERARVFKFGKAGSPTQSFEGTFQACLTGSGLISYEDFKKKNDEGTLDEPIKVVNALIQELEKLHLLVNVDEHILEFIDEWFGKMKNLNILYLGRWKAQVTHHIEVEDPKFFEKLGSLRYVKYLSLQGVSNIIALHNSILELTNLEVLDLRACSNLESIPERIEKLQKLKQLDMSECYLLTHMPKGLSQLTDLRVLKGFFVGKDEYHKGCTIGGLQKLKFLEKLCIYTDWKDFPKEMHVAEMEELKALTKLTITWGVGTNTNTNNDPKTAEDKEKHEASAGTEGSAKLPTSLEKLDLKCFPKEKTPSWLRVENLQGVSLRKLYIRGGKFRDIGQYQGVADDETKRWTKVERLRLKYLGEIEMEWRQLQGLFPKLEYLEKVRCPNLTLFPCDVKGVWNKKD